MYFDDKYLAIFQRIGFLLFVIGFRGLIEFASLRSQGRGFNCCGLLCRPRKIFVSNLLRRCNLRAPIYRGEACSLHHREDLFFDQVVQDLFSVERIRVYF